MTHPVDDDRRDARHELPDDDDADRACRPSSGGPEGWVFAILILIPLPMIGVLLIGTGSPPQHACGLMALIVGVGAGSLWMVVRILWEPYRRRFPAVHPTERVRWKRLQIVRLGIVGGFNHCVDVGSDEGHVHLHLMAPLGWLARPMSIPRSEIEWDGTQAPPSRFGMAKVRLRGKRSLLPAWVFPTEV